MCGECVAVGAKCLLKLIGDPVINYVSYIKRYDDHIQTLGVKLNDLQIRKCSIDNKVKIGLQKQEKLSGETARWLQTIRELTQGVALKKFMILDENVAHYGVRLMEPKVLKQLLMEDKEMQGIVVRVLKQHKENDEVGSVEVARVLVDVMRNATEEFKNAIQEDTVMAETALDVLGEDKLKYLEMYDKDFAEILKRARRNREEKFLKNYLNEEEKLNSINLEHKTRIIDAAESALKPVGNLVKPLGIFLDDESFKKAVPAGLPEGLKYGLQVIEGLVSAGLKRDMKESVARQSDRCCLAAVVCTFHDHYQVSKAADNLAKDIQRNMIDKSPQEVTEPTNIDDLNPIPSGYMGGFDSREEILRKIMEKLTQSQVNSVAVFGMGGTGKTTLAKEVHHRAKELFHIKVMVEASQSPDIGRIQEEIGESIGLPLHEVHSVALKAVKLYNSLISKEEGTILIILDNIWAKLDLDEIGIPRQCKLLLTTREKKVCKVMDVHDANILEVDLLNPGEARHFFIAQAGNGINDRQYDDVVERLLRKCGGLPLAIVATTNTLKDQDLSHWRNFADELEKPISSQVGREHRNAYAILETSFKLFESDEKRMFFLLACLSPIGSSISVEDLLYFGIGLSLFPHVNKLSEAKGQAKRWAEELVSSSMLLKGDYDGHVKIHDVVRASAISFAAKDDAHKFLVDAIPRWMEDKILRNYKGISLLSGNGNLFYSRLNGVKTDKLQILLLKGDMSPEFPSSFFEGMENLEVLFLSNMDFQTELPESIGNLKKLRTLELKGCRLGDIKWIGELVNLVVLSLSGSLLKEELPDEIGELHNLRLLDLRKCKGKLLVNPSAFNGLSQLEGLYMFERTNLIQEKISLSRSNYLNSLFMNVLELEQLPIVGESFAEEVDEFLVHVGSRGRYADIFSEELRWLVIDNVSITTSSLGTVNGVSVSLSGESNCLHVLLKKSEWLIMEETELLENLVPELDKSGFKDLRHLRLFKCNNLEFLVNTKGHQRFDLIAFPRLETLKISSSEELENIWHGETQNVGSIFPNLQNLDLENLGNLKCALPLHLIPHSLTNIVIHSCKRVNFVFVTSIGEFQSNMNFINFPSLKYMYLSGLSNLISLLGPEKSSESSDELQGQESLFNAKMVFPALETFKVGFCDNIVKLWSKQFDQRGFRNLRDLTIRWCEKLTSIGPLSIFCTFERLESLTIDSCKNMVEIITPEETQEANGTVEFPQLKSLIIHRCDSLESFYGGGSILEFPKLIKLELSYLENMKSFGGTGDSSALFHRKIKFPCLEELELDHISDYVRALWDSVSEEAGENPVPMLKRLILSLRHGLSMIQPMITQNLIYVEFKQLDGEFLFACPIATGNSECELMEHKLEKVENLTVESCEYLNELFEEGTYSAASTVHFCEQLKCLRLKSLPALNIIPLHLFKGLCSLHLGYLEWEYLILLDADADADAGVIHKSLQHLETLEVSGLKNMKQVIKDQTEGPDDNNLVFEFPRLKAIEFTWLDSLTCFGTTSKATLRLPSLESLELDFCKGIEYFWSGPIIAPKLKKVRIHICQRIVSLFAGNETDCTLQFPSLEEISIEYCDKLDSFSSMPIVAPKLRQVNLQRCSTMKWLLLGGNDLDHVQELLSLERVQINNCPNIQSLSSGPLRAPSLAHVIHDEKEYSRLETEDLAGLLSELPLKITFVPEINSQLDEELRRNGADVQRIAGIAKALSAECAALNSLDHVQELPFLETVEIKDCPIIQSLSSGPLQAPNLAHVIHDKKQYLRLETDDLAGLLLELPRKITSVPEITSQSDEEFSEAYADFQ